SPQLSYFRAKRIVDRLALEPQQFALVLAGDIRRRRRRLLIGCHHCQDDSERDYSCCDPADHSRASHCRSKSTQLPAAKEVTPITEPPSVLMPVAAIPLPPVAIPAPDIALRT